MCKLLMMLFTVVVHRFAGNGPTFCPIYYYYYTVSNVEVNINVRNIKHCASFIFI